MKETHMKLSIPKARLAAPLMSEGRVLS